MILNNDNFVLFAANNYKTKQILDTEEFYDDLNRFKYIKRLIGRYESHDDLKERLIINHIIILHNVFGIDAAKVMLLHKIDKRHWNIIKPFLVYLNYLREDELVDIPMDPTVVERLRKL